MIEGIEYNLDLKSLSLYENYHLYPEKPFPFKIRKVRWKYTYENLKFSESPFSPGLLQLSLFDSNDAILFKNEEGVLDFNGEYFFELETPFICNNFLKLKIRQPNSWMDFKIKLQVQIFGEYILDKAKKPKLEWEDYLKKQKIARKRAIDNYSEIEKLDISKSTFFTLLIPVLSFFSWTYFPSFFEFLLVCTIL
jgi:hypothetical protein